MSMENVVIQLAQDVEELRKDITNAVHFIKGNGDPTTGLLWMVADLTRLLATNTQLIETYRQISEKASISAEKRWADHLVEAHRKERSAFWTSVQDSAIRYTVNGIVLLVLGLLALGLVTFIRSSTGAF